MRPYTIFVDLDGTLVQHNHEPETNPDVFLPGALDRLDAWYKQGHLIVITTARNPFEAKETVALIRKRFDDMVPVVYQCTTGVRVLINDRSPEGQNKAFAINVNRDEGIDGVVLE